jgi:hypothetical protein
MHENREISSTPSRVCEGRSAKAINRTADMHVLEKSDCAALPVNRPNKGRQLPAEAGEERAQLEENIVSTAHAPDSEQESACPSDWTVGVKKASVTDSLSRYFILQKSRMRRRARTDLCGGRSVMGVPTATVTPRDFRMADYRELARNSVNTRFRGLIVRS